MRQVSISRQEWLRVGLFIIALLLITSLPYVIGWLSQGSEWVFSGFVFGADDGHSYLGKMRLGARGLLDFYLFYTPEPHPSAPLIFLPYILPGWVVGGFISEQSPALTGALLLTFHAMRWVFNTLLVVVLYRFIAGFIRRPGTRFTALLLATLGGGLGWLLLLIGTEPPEFLIPEGFGFLILLGLPHLALARAALLGGFILLFQALDRPQALTPRLMLAGLCWCVVGLTVPFYLAILYVMLGMWGLALWIRQRRFPLRLAIRGGVAAGLTLPLFIYFNVVFSANPVFATWTAQNILLSPSPLAYALAYGLLISFGVIGWRWVWRRAEEQGRYALLFWPLVIPALVYLPFISVQRRLAEAVLVALAILAAVGMRFALRHRIGKRLVRPALALMLTSSLLFGLVTLLVATQPAPPLFRPAAEVRMLNWLNQHSTPDAVTLSAFSTGNVLPAYTHLRPYVGHGPETADALNKTAMTARFFSSQLTAEERLALYRGFNMRYVIYGPSEQALSQGATPNWLDDGRLIYDQDGYQVYELAYPPM